MNSLFGIKLNLKVGRGVRFLAIFKNLHSENNWLQIPDLLGKAEDDVATEIKEGSALHGSCLDDTKWKCPNLTLLY